MNEGYSLDLSMLGFPQYSALTFGGKKILKLSNDSGTVQLSFDKDIELDKPLKFTISISSSMKILEQVEAIRKLEGILDENGKLNEIVITVPQKFAKPEILFAYDLISKGITQQDLARKLYGDNVVDNRWFAISDSLRAQTRRLIAQANMFVETSVFDFF
ncbi:MAG: DUF2285 domain-containing protein [Hyphomicrobiales bacterium]